MAQPFATALTSLPGRELRNWSVIFLKVSRDKTAANMKATIVDQNQSLTEMISLLKSNNLPYQDIKLENNLFVSYENESGKVIGSGGLELYGPYALLRSVAVNETHRGKSFGKEIVKDLLVRAEQRSLREIYLLTETAHDFFLKRGFTDVARDNVPPEVKASSEFASVCPVSASCMVFRF